MALTGIQITDLTSIGNAIHANDVLPIVNLSVDETQKVTVTDLGNYILGNVAANTPIQLAVYASNSARDGAITSPSAGMMIYVTGSGMQVRGATAWNLIAGSGT